MKAFVLSICLIAGPLAHASLGSNFGLNENSMQSRLPVTNGYQMNKLNRELLQNLYEVELADASSASIAKVNALMNFAGKCDAFATLKDMGQWGELILKELKRNRYNELYRGAPDLSQTCANFNSMDDNGREVVWVMVVNAMAHLESSCKPEAFAPGPNGTAIGLLQLHKGAEQRYGKYCKKGDGKTSESTFRCGLSMIEGQLSRDNALFSRNSYWDVLRPQGVDQKYLKIKKAIKNLSICKVGSKPVEPAKVEPKPAPSPTPAPVEVAPATTPDVETTPAVNVEPMTVEEAIHAASFGDQTGG